MMRWIRYTPPHNTRWNTPANWIEVGAHGYVCAQSHVDRLTAQMHSPRVYLSPPAHVVLSRPRIVRARMRVSTACPRPYPKGGGSAKTGFGKCAPIFIEYSPPPRYTYRLFHPPRSHPGSTRFNANTLIRRSLPETIVSRNQKNKNIFAKTFAFMDPMYVYLRSQQQTMSVLIIKLKDPQPLDCPRCKFKHGYQYSDLFRMSYTSFHDAGGMYEGGQYNDGLCLNRGVLLYCTNCGEKLPFKLDRNTVGDVS